MTPTTLRFVVLACRTSAIAEISTSTNAGTTPSVSSTRWSASGNRSANVAAGASGINTGNSVRSLTSNTTCGFQNNTLAYQLPRIVAGSDTGGTTGRFTRPRSFLVAGILNTATSLAPRQHQNQQTTPTEPQPQSRGNGATRASSHTSLLPCSPVDQTQCQIWAATSGRIEGCHLSHGLYQAEVRLFRIRSNSVAGSVESAVDVGWMWGAAFKERA